MNNFDDYGTFHVLNCNFLPRGYSWLGLKLMRETNGKNIVYVQIHIFVLKKRYIAENTFEHTKVVE